jgi:alkylhydroperoxidase/carboxymuconolactone decarboxylase family protein YurZ
MKRRRMDPRLRELVALAALAAFGCGLALSQGDLLFVAVFGAACALTIIEAMRRLRRNMVDAQSPVAIRALRHFCLGIVSERLGHLDP